VAGSALLLGVAALIFEDTPAMAIAVAALVALCTTTLLLARAGRQALAAHLFVLVPFGGVVVDMILFGDDSPYLTSTLVSFIILAAFLIDARFALALGGVAIVAQIATYASLGSTTDVSAEQLRIWGAAVFHVGIVAFVIWLFARESNQNFELLRRRLLRNDTLLDEVPDSASRLGAATQEIFAMMQQLAQGTLRQSSAVSETQQVMRSLSVAADTIVDATAAVQAHAETTLRNNEQVATHIAALTRHSRDIEQVLEFIKEVASKSDLLALNAALEGTKAGEAGRGFSLVATQMQRLAEDVARSALQIRKLTSDIHAATSTSQLAIEEATSLARSTAEAAQQITYVTQQQRSGVDQVSTAMNEIAEITSQTSSSANQTIASADELRTLAEHLGRVVERYKDAEAAGRAA
jgi:methyl-accepting chemotaxis protein